MERTEVLTAIYLDSDEDEDPLRLSPPASPQRAYIMKPAPATSVTPKDKILASTHCKRIAPTRVTEAIETIDLDPPTPPSNTTEHVTKVPLSAKKNSPHKYEIGSTMNKLFGSQAANRDVFLKFMEICTACHNTAELEKILNKRIKPHYKQLEPSYAESEDFCNLLEENISIMAKSPSSVFNCLVNVDEEMKSKRIGLNGKKNYKHVTKTSLNKQTNSPRANKPSTSSKAQEDDEQISGDELIEENSEEARKRKKRDKHVNKLNKALVQCHKKIQRLEEKEVDWDEEDDSSYLQLQRYRRRCIDIHRKIVELTGVRDDSKKRRTRVACVTPYPDVSAAIERYVSSNGTFPDFTDILKIYTDAKIGLRPVELNALAEKSFKEIGNQIQKDRQVYDWNLACYFLGSDPDPAEEDPQLKRKLSDNKKLADSKLDEVLASFTRRQYELRLEPDDVPDELAAQTDNSDDDDNDEDDGGRRDKSPDVGAPDSDESDSGSDAPSKSSKNSKSSKRLSQDKMPEHKSRRDKTDERGKPSSGTRNAVRIKKIHLDTPLPENELWSFTDEAVMKANMRNLPSTASRPPSPNRTEDEAPRSSQTKPQKINVVSPLKKYQEETLLNYLEMTYKIPSSVIDGKGVTSSSLSVEGSMRKRPGGLGDFAYSTASKISRRCEKTGSDPEVTSTSVDGDLSLSHDFDVGAQIVWESTGCVPAMKTKAACTNVRTKFQEKASVAAFVSDKNSKHGFGLVSKFEEKATSRLSAADATSPSKREVYSKPGTGLDAKNNYDISKEADVCVRESPRKVYVKMSKRAHGEAVASEKETTLAYAQMPEEIVLGEEMTAAQEIVQEVSNHSWNDDSVDTMFFGETLDAEEKVVEKTADSSDDNTLDLADWDSMIIPTMVAKEVLLVSTDIGEQPEELVIETSTEVDLDSSDEYIQSPPLIKTYERKGRVGIVPTRTNLPANDQPTASELKPISTDKVVRTPPKTILLERNGAEILPIRKDLSSAQTSRGTSSTKPNLERERNNHLDGAVLVKSPCEPSPNGHKRAASGTIRAWKEAGASKGISYTAPIPSKRRVGEPEVKSKTEQNAVTISDANRSQTVSPSGKSKSEADQLVFVTDREHAVQVLKVLPSSQEVLQSTTTERNAFPGSSGSVLRMNPPAKDFTKMPIEGTVETSTWRITSVYSEQSQQTALPPVKMTARKSIAGKSSRLKSVTAVVTENLLYNRLKEEPIRASGRQGSGKTSSGSIIDPEIIVIDSD